MPKFNERPGYLKSRPLTQADVDERALRAIELRLLDMAAVNLDRPPRVLDFGCGRGAFVARLRQAGVEAYGVEISPLYVDSARALLGQAPDWVSLIQDGRSRFPDGYFDLVISDQVLEHVEDLEGVAAEIARVTAPGGLGLHILPPKWSVIEAHLKMPCVHWLDAGPLRRKLIEAWIRMKVGVRAFPKLGADSRATIYEQYLAAETFYRRRRTIFGAFAARSLAPADISLLKLRISGGVLQRLSRLPVLGAMFGLAYGHFRQLYFVTVQAPGTPLN